MGRGVTIPFNSNLLKAELIRRSWTIEMVGEALGVSRQAANAWFVAERIPPRWLSDLTEKLNLDVSFIKQVLDYQDSPKDLMREIIKLRNENAKLKAAIVALTQEDP